MRQAFSTLAFLFGHLTFVKCSPAPNPPTTTMLLEPSPSLCGVDPINCNRPADASIFVCENVNWQPPCYLFHLDVVNDAQYGWRESPSQWADGSWKVGSWGPAPGIQTTLFSNYQVNKSSPTDPESTYPGTPDVGPFWRENIYSFIAGWDPNRDPSTLPQTTAKLVPAPTFVAPGSRKRLYEVPDHERPAWVRRAYF